MLPTSTWRTSWPSAARASSSAAGRNRASPSARQPSTRPSKIKRA